jgi:ankyrin repeat protein
MKDLSLNHSKNIDDQLFDAVEKGDISLTKRLIKKGANVNAYHEYEIYELCTCLYIALRAGKLEIAKLLIASGADINLLIYLFSDYTHERHLLSATLGGEEHHLEGIKLLLEAGLDLSTLNKDRNPLMNLCGCYGDAEFNKRSYKCCELLIENGVIINDISFQEETPLFKAAIRGLEDIAELLIDHGAEKNLASCFLLKDYTNICNYRNKTSVVNNEAYILCKAAEYGNLRLLEIMNNFGVNINVSVTDKFNRTRTILSHATFQPLTLEWLLKNGVKQIPNEVLCSAALSITSRGLESLEILLNAGANPNDRWKENLSTALHTALSHDDFVYEKTKLLIEAGADVNAKDSNGLSSMHYLFKNEVNSPTFYPSEEDILKIMNLLIEYNTSANELDIIGNTPLHLAAKNGYSLNIISKLIALGNDKYSKNYYGETPAILAAKNNRKEAFEFLASTEDKRNISAIFCLGTQEEVLECINNTKDFKIKDSEYNSLLHYLVSRDSLEMIEALVNKDININSFNNSRKTAVDLAIEYNKGLISEYLKIHGGKTSKNSVSEDFYDCGYWIPKANGEISINYTIAGITKEYCDQHNFKEKTSPISSSQKSLLMKVFEYISSIFEINFIQVKDPNNADFYIGQVLDKTIDANLCEFVIKSDSIIEKANLAINGFNINDAKIKYYPNYCFAKILQNIFDVLVFLRGHSFVSRSIKDYISRTLLDHEYNINFSDFDLLVLSSRYSLKKDYIKVINSSSQQTKPAEYSIISEETIDLLRNGKASDIQKLIKNGFEINRRYKQNENIYLIHPLEEAVESKNIEAVKALIDAGANVNLICSYYNLLAGVCKRDHEHKRLEIAKILLNAGADPNFYTYITGSEIPLIEAAYHKNIEVCQLLLEKGAELNARDNLGNTAIHEAAINGSIEITKLLYNNGAEVDLTSAFVLDLKDKIEELTQEMTSKECKNILSNLLREAIRKQNLVLTKALIEYHVIIDDYLFRETIRSGNIEIIRLLILNGANLEAIDSYENTVLHIAAQNNQNNDLVKLLLESGMDPNRINDDGYTALHIAVLHIPPLYGNFDVINTLVNYGADVKIKDKKGNNIFHLIAKHPHLLKYCEFFANRGLDINEENDNYETMLDLAIENKVDTIVVDIFKEHGGNLNAVPEECSYIEYAIDCDNFSIIPNLLFNGAKVLLISALKLNMKNEAISILNESENIPINQKDFNDDTPLHHAAKKGYLDVVMLLIKKGIDINAINKSNETALDLAENNSSNCFESISLISYLKTYGAINGQTKLLIENARKERNNSNKIPTNIIDMKTRKILYLENFDEKLN